MQGIRWSWRTKHVYSILDHLFLFVLVNSRNIFCILTQISLIKFLNARNTHKVQKARDESGKYTGSEKEYALLENKSHLNFGIRAIRCYILRNLILNL